MGAALTPKDNLGGILELIQREVVEPAESSIIKSYIRDFLFDVRAKKFTFSEKSTTFPTVADQAEYPFGQDSVPGNVIRIELLRSLNGTTYSPCRPVSLDELRRRQETGVASTNRPDLYAVFDRQLHLWPTPSGVVTMAMDYQIDSTLDVVTGAPFDEWTSEDSFTNEFFREGRALLTSYVLIRWGLGRGRDQELANAQTAVYNKVLSQLRQEYAVARHGDGCSEAHW